MSEVLLLHQQAMEKADSAIYAKSKKDQQLSRAFFSEAYELERKAAEYYRDKLDTEPTRSILYRSAAALAIDANLFPEAIKMIGAGLSGNPPEEIALELKNLFEKADFSRHLVLKGVEIDSNEFQLSFMGNVIGSGLALVNPVFERIQTVQKLIYRTAQRILGYEFSDNSINNISRTFPLYTTFGMANSYSVILKLGKPEQSTLPGFNQPEEIIDEVFKCIEIYNSENFNELNNHISDQDYRDNFISLVEKISPDGEEISGIGFTSLRNKQEKSVSLIHPKSSLKRNQYEYSKILQEDGMQTVSNIISGQLLAADATSQKKNIIQIIINENERFKVLVPIGMMDDIVKPLWGEKVIINYIKKKNSNILQTIEKA